METAALTLCYETASGHGRTIRQNEKVFISQLALNISGGVKALHISLSFRKTITVWILMKENES